MTTNIPFSVPGAVFDSGKEITEGFAKKSIRPEDVRNDPVASQAL